MHLWQIRQFPNYRQTSLRLTLGRVVSNARVATCLLAMVSVCVWAVGVAAAAEKPTPAEEFLEKVRQELPKHQSIRAEVRQTVSIGNEQFKIGGEYISAGQKLKVNYSVLPDQGAKGQMMEVCDGKDLWSMQSLPDLYRVTHRNVQQILAARMAMPQNAVTESAARVELGLGGVAALLASLERTMTFDQMKQEEGGNSPRTVVQGHWKPQYLTQFAKEKKNGEEILPPYFPDRVRLYVNSKTLFPERIVYLKKQPQKSNFVPLVNLEFLNVQFDAPISDDTFVFMVPDGINVEEVTQQYIDRMQPPAAAAPPAQAPVAK